MKKPEEGSVDFCSQIYSKLPSAMKLKHCGAKETGMSQWLSVLYSVCVIINQVLGAGCFLWCCAGRQ